MTALRQLAEKMGMYDYIRYSRAYLFLLHFRNPQYLAALRADAKFYHRVLNDHLGRAPQLVFDVGANFGDKTWAFREIRARVVAVEPDSKCCAALGQRFRRDSEVTIERVALGPCIGSAILYTQAPGSAYNTLSEKHSQIYHHNRAGATEKSPQSSPNIEISTLDRLIEKYGVPDYIKIDVEGFEKAVISGLSRAVPVLSFEANLPYFLSETVDIVGVLQRLDPEVTFNLLPAGADTLVTADSFGAEQLLEQLSGTQERTFDVFCFCPGSRP